MPLLVESLSPSDVPLDVDVEVPSVPVSELSRLLIDLVVPTLSPLEEPVFSETLVPLLFPY